MSAWSSGIAPTARGGLPPHSKVAGVGRLIVAISLWLHAVAMPTMLSAASTEPGGQGTNGPAKAGSAPVVVVTNRLPVLLAAPKTTNTFLQETNVPWFGKLAWDALEKEVTSKPRDTNAVFTFTVTNIWTNEIIVFNLNPSCHCTTGEMPEEPWHLKPGRSGPIDVTVEFEDGPEDLERMVEVQTSVGSPLLVMRVMAAPEPPPRTFTTTNRMVLPATNR